MRESKKLWARFAKSGKLNDYLEYCKARKAENMKSKSDGIKEPRDQSSL